MDHPLDNGFCEDRGLFAEPAPKKFLSEILQLSGLIDEEFPETKLPPA